MKIVYFRIENFRSIRLAEAVNPPDLVVVCGSNGSGKSALFNALITAKEAAAPYGGGFQLDRSFISAGAETCSISIELAFDDNERSYMQTVPPGGQFKPYSSASARIDFVAHRNLSPPASVECPDAVRRLLSSYSRSADAPGFFDYIDAHRSYPRVSLNTWSPDVMNDEATKGTLVRPPSDALHSLNTGSKFQFTKHYLANLAVRDLQDLQKSLKLGVPTESDSLRELRSLFDEFLSPLKFIEVDITASPFRFVIQTPGGEIDIDDLSSGE
jgi:energy-coupling factor transporter ATP-binding protein EcfA2